MLANKANPDYLHVRAFYDLIPRDSKIALPIIAIAEIEYGMAKVTPGDPRQRKEVRQFFEDHPLHFGIDYHTIEPYALVRAKLWELYGTLRGGKMRSHHEKLPDELRVRETAKWIGIDERDLLIVSVALQYNIVFATKDRNVEMQRIEEAVAQVVAAGRWPKNSGALTGRRRSHLRSHHRRHRLRRHLRPPLPPNKSRRMRCARL